MTRAEAAAYLASLPLLPVRPAAYPAPVPPRAKQVTAWLTCRKRNARGRLSCGR